MLSPSRFSPLLLTLAAATLAAQDTTGTVTGTVYTRAGKVVASATVHIASPNLLGERTAQTDGNGKYRIPLLPNGDYALTASAKGFLPGKGVFRVLAGQTSRSDVILATEDEVRKVTEATVEVVAQLTQADKTETLTQTNFSIDNLDQLMSSNLYAATALSPGVMGAGSQPSIRGGSSAGTKFLLNGMQVSSGAWGGDKGDLTIQDMIESVAVIQSPLNARYGNTDGGIVAMVTTKGSNEFSGSLRVKLNAYGLNSASSNGGQNGLYGNVGTGQNYGNYINMGNDLAYPKNNGQPGFSYIPWADTSMSTYDITLRGPIWKDHITFAYGGTFTPQVNSTQSLNRLLSSPTPQPTDYAGTIFYLNDDTALRNANNYQQGALVSSKNKQTYNQIVLFYQINADHQIEYNYTQNDHRQTNYGWYPIDASVPGQPAGTSTRMWDIGYKGIIGASSILEAKFGRVFRANPMPATSTPAIWNIDGPTVVPYGNGSYLANSFLDYANYGATAPSTYGATLDHGDSTLDTGFTLNYEVMADWHGNHLIDLGGEYQAFEWNTQIVGSFSPLNYFNAGQLATNYGVLQGGLPHWPDNVAPTDVNGQYIVMNWQVQAYNLVGGPSSIAYAQSLAALNSIGLGAAEGAALLNQMLYNIPGGRNLTPYLTLYQGNPVGIYKQPQTSIYINDLWSIDQHHSIMAGIRSDTMKLTQDAGTLRTFTRITPRFEYKYDIHGNQSRILNVSFAQFNDRVPAGQFQNFVQTRLPYSYTMYWTGTAPGANPNVPYLVSQSQLLDLNNYGYLGNASGPGTFQMDPHWKSPYSTEYTVGFRRSFPSGMSWHLTAIYKTWRDLYDSFPVNTSQTIPNPVNANSTVSVYPRLLANDASVVKTYKSAEFEWTLPLGKRLMFQGNYTFARSMANAAVVNDNPGSNMTPYGNFRNWFENFYPRAAFNPVMQQIPEHNVIAWFVYDLSVTGIKSSLAYRMNYTSGNPDSRVAAVNVGTPTIPGNPIGLNPFVNIYMGGAGQFSTQEWFTDAIKYDLEIKVAGPVRLFTSVEVINPLNHRAPGWNGINPYNYGDQYGVPTYWAHGWRAQGDVATAGVSSARLQPRAFTFECGLKF